LVFGQRADENSGCGDGRSGISGSFREGEDRPKRGSRFCVLSNPKSEGEKKTFGREKWGIRQERRWEFRIHSQEGQDFSVSTTSVQFITHKRKINCESRSVDLTNNGMVNKDVPLTGLHLSLDRRCLRKHPCHTWKVELF
jgi:hypothetical protein